MSRNQAVAEEFAAALGLGRPAVRVDRINGMRRRDAWMVALFDSVAEVGITAHIYGSQRLHAYIEVTGGEADAARVGELLAQTVAALRHERGQAEAGQDGRPDEGNAEQADAGQAPPQG